MQYLRLLLLIFITVQILMPGDNKSSKVDVNYVYDKIGFCDSENWRGFLLKDINKLSEVKGISIKEMIENVKIKYQLSDIIIGWLNTEIVNHNQNILQPSNSDPLKITGIAYGFVYDEKFNYEIKICFDSLIVDNNKIGIEKNKNCFGDKNAFELLQSIQEVMIVNNVTIIEGLQSKPIPVPDARKEEIEEKENGE